MELSNKTIAFLGDSITEGAGATSNDKCFVSKVKELAGLKNALNYGIGGTRIAPQKKPSECSVWDKDYIGRIPGMEKDVDAVVVFGGTNDFGHGDAPFGGFGDKTPDTFSGACYVMLKSLVEKYPDVPVLVITPLHRLGEDGTVNEIGLQRVPLSDYVQIIRKTAEKFSLPVLDLYSKSGMQPEIEAQNNLYFFDGLHPNDFGHERVARLVINALESIIG